MSSGAFRAVVLGFLLLLLDMGRHRGTMPGVGATNVGRPRRPMRRSGVIVGARLAILLFRSAACCRQFVKRAKYRSWLGLISLADFARWSVLGMCLASMSIVAVRTFPSGCV